MRLERAMHSIFHDVAKRQIGFEWNGKKITRFPDWDSHKWWWVYGYGYAWILFYEFQCAAYNGRDWGASDERERVRGVKRIREIWFHS